MLHPTVWQYTAIILLQPLRNDGLYNFAKTRINLANSCWSLLNAVMIAFIVTRFRRRWMFMLSAGSMCLVYVAMTVSFEKLREAKDAGMHNGAAAISALFFYFAFSPCYNIGNNSLTYSKSLLQDADKEANLSSVSGRTFPLR